MGIFVSRTWFIYARDADDKWIETPLASTVAHEEDVEFHMGRFKHYVFKLALGELDSTISKIYLYCGTRVAKCIFMKEEKKIYVEFSSAEAASAWDTCKRSKRGLMFDRRFEETSKEVYKVVFSYLQDSQVVSR